MESPKNGPTLYGLAELIKIKPDIIIIETKTPVIKYHWKIIEKIKAKLPQSRVVLMGDHVTALPKESFKKCSVDFVITGGDFDFLMLSIANHLAKKPSFVPEYTTDKVKKSLIPAGPS